MDLTLYSADEEFGCYIASNESCDTFRQIYGPPIHLIRNFQDTSLIIFTACLHVNLMCSITLFLSFGEQMFAFVRNCLWCSNNNMYRGMRDIYTVIPYYRHTNIPDSKWPCP
jgi:hypothetical protein